MRIVMMGTGTFAEPAFEALLAGPHQVVGLVTQPDRVAGQERGSTRQTGRGMKNIALDETAGALEARLAPLGARLALRVIEQLSAGAAKGIPQDKSQATKAPKLTKEHGLIDWSRTAEQVRNHVRAMQPWPTAYTFW